MLALGGLTCGRDTSLLLKFRFPSWVSAWHAHSPLDISTSLVQRAKPPKLANSLLIKSYRFIPPSPLTVVPSLAQGHYHLRLEITQPNAPLLSVPHTAAREMISKILSMPLPGPP